MGGDVVIECPPCRTHRRLSTAEATPVCDCAGPWGTGERCISCGSPRGTASVPASDEERVVEYVRRIWDDPTEERIKLRALLVEVRADERRRASASPLEPTLREMIADWRMNAVANEEDVHPNADKPERKACNTCAASAWQDAAADLETTLDEHRVSSNASPDAVMTLLKAAGLALEWTAREAPHQADADERYPWWRALQAAQRDVLESRSGSAFRGKVQCILGLEGREVSDDDILDAIRSGLNKRPDPSAVVDAARAWCRDFLSVDGTTRAVTFNRQWSRLDSAVSQYDNPYEAAPCASDGAELDSPNFVPQAARDLEARGFDRVNRAASKAGPDHNPAQSAKSYGVPVSSGASSSDDLCRHPIVEIDATKGHSFVRCIGCRMVLAMPTTIVDRRVSGEAKPERDWKAEAEWATAVHKEVRARNDALLLENERLRREMASASDDCQLCGRLTDQRTFLGPICERCQEAPPTPNASLAPEWQGDAIASVLGGAPTVNPSPDGQGLVIGAGLSSCATQQGLAIANLCATADIVARQMETKLKHGRASRAEVEMAKAAAEWRAVCALPFTSATKEKP
jgi:hypothetical protein